MMAFVLSSPHHMPQEKIQSLVMNLFSVWKGKRRQKAGWVVCSRMVGSQGVMPLLPPSWRQKRKEKRNSKTDKELLVQCRPGAEPQPTCRTEPLHPQVVQSKLLKW